MFISWAIASVPYLMALYVLLTRGSIALGAILLAQLVLNYLLKIGIREPRPQGSDATCGFSSFGMPSAHAQLVIFLVLLIWPKSPFAWALTIAVLVQRVVSKCHTVSQVVAGAAAGASIYYVTIRLFPYIAQPHLSS